MDSVRRVKPGSRAGGRVAALWSEPMPASPFCRSNPGRRHSPRFPVSALARMLFAIESQNAAIARAHSQTEAAASSNGPTASAGAGRSAGNAAAIALAARSACGWAYHDESLDSAFPRTSRSNRYWPQ